MEKNESQVIRMVIKQITNLQGTVTYMKTVIVYGMNNNIGGIESYLLNVYKQLHNQVKFVFLVEDILNPDKFIFKEEIENYGGEYIFIPEHHQLIVYTKTFREILRYYRKETGTIYVNVNYIAFDIIPIMIALSENYRVITHSHNTMQEPLKKWRYRISAGMRRSFGMAKLKKAHVERLAITKLAGNYLYRGKPFQIISPGIEPKKFIYNEKTRKKMRADYGVNHCMVLGFVGRITPVKNPLFLVDVLAEAKKVIPDIKLMIVGDGNMKEEMISRAKILNVSEDMIFTCSVKNVQDYLQSMDVLLAPSFSEGLGLGIIEAQSIGLPCICAKGNVPEDVNVTGKVQFCDLNSGSEEWVRLIQKSHSEHFDKNKMNSMVEKSDFNIENAAKKLLKVIE